MINSVMPLIDFSFDDLFDIFLSHDDEKFFFQDLH